MPSLAELTDQYPQQDNSLPVEQPYRGGNLGPLQPVTTAPIGNTAVIVPDTQVVAQSDPNSVGSSGSQIIDKLLGLGGQERYQLWPEKVVRDAISAPHDIMQANPYPEGSEEAGYYEDLRQKSMVPAALNMSALAGTGGLAGVGEEVGTALGSSPFLRPALKYENKIYKAPVGGQHLDALPAHLQDTFQQQAMSGEDISNFNFGFMNHKGQFLNREAALDYAVKEGLVDPHAGQYGALTSTLLADSSKPGTAIEAMAKTGQPFYSALEHNVNAIQQPKMTGNQWLGTLANKPGVKPEELDWTGVKSFLEERGNQPVTKKELQEHLQNNKVELKEVDKGNSETHFLHYKQDLEHDLRRFDSILPEFKSEADIALARQHNPQFKETVKDYTNSRIWNAIQEAKKPIDFPEGLFKQYDTQAEAEAARKAAGAEEHLDISKKLNYQDTKYHSYQLPGGENYREKLLTLPGKPEVYDQNLMYYMRKYPQVTKEIKTLDDVALAQKHNAAFKETMKGISPEEVLATARASERPEVQSYKSSHWEEPNILAHVRMNDRMIDGKKSLGILEAQSDWHQQGRKMKGYALSPAERERWEAIKKKNDKNLTAEDHKDIEDLGRRSVISGLPPDAPFKKTWHELVLKRMIREAAEKGYDNLHFPGSPETVAKVEGWSNFKIKTVDGKPRYFTGDQDVTPIIDRYLVDFPRFLNKIGKEHGVKVNSLEIPGKLSNKMGEPPEIIKLHHMDIPESLKNTALSKGFPLFSNKYIFTPVQGDPFSDKK